MFNMLCRATPCHSCNCPLFGIGRCSKYFKEQPITECVDLLLQLLCSHKYHELFIQENLRNVFIKEIYAIENFFKEEYSVVK